MKPSTPTTLTPTPLALRPRETATALPISPPAYAKSRGVKPDTVRLWIRTGQLDAVNYAKNPGGKPCWKIFPDAIEKFEARRAARPAPKPERKTKSVEITEYV